MVEKTTVNMSGLNPPSFPERTVSFVQEHPVGFAVGFSIYRIITIALTAIFIVMVYIRTKNGWRFGDFWKGKPGFFGAIRQRKGTFSRYYSKEANKPGRPLSAWFNYGPPAKI